MHRITLPTPFPVGPVNCWLLRGDPLTLVDTGPDTPDALVALELGLAGFGLRIEDVELLLLTHQHSDHVGLAGTIRARSGCAVAAQLALAGYVGDVQRSLVAEEAWGDGLLRLHGTPPERRATFLEITRDRRRYGGGGVAVDRIAHISSNPLAHRPPTGSDDPALRSSSLAAYLESLARTAEEDLSLLHTGHGEVIREHRPLIAERVRLHHERADQVYEALAAGPQSASRLSTTLWPAVAVNQTYLTLCEVLGALDVLEADGRALSAVCDDAMVYERT